MWQDGFVKNWGKDVLTLDMRNSSLRFMCTIQGLKKVMLRCSTLFGFHPVCWSHGMSCEYFLCTILFFWLLMPINTYGIASHKRGHNPFLEVYWAFRCDLAILGTNSDTYCEKKAWHVFFILCLSLCPYYIVVPLQAFLVVIKSDVLNILKILKRVRFKNSFVFHGHYYKATV